MAAAAVVKKLYTLKAETELRCEVGEGEVLLVRLVNGTYEVFGIELVANREYI
jgi:N-terminal beta-sandwich domain of polyadenylation factor